MRWICIFSLSFISSFFQAQKTTGVHVVSESYTNPEYPGGKIALDEFLIKNAKYPESMKSGTVDGKVVITVKIDEKGKIIDALPIGKCHECNAEILRIIKLLSPFTPALKNGKPVSCTIPISFRFNPPHDSLLTYENKHLIGIWVLQKTKKVCSDCPSIKFSEDQTATINSDSLSWQLNARTLKISNVGIPKRLNNFLTERAYHISFKNYFNEMHLENENEKYILIKRINK